jgi:alpha-L-arabinofuranosidase
MKRNIFRTIEIIILLIPIVRIKAQNPIFIDATQVENAISPYLYGSCIEDVNHEIYGGLYNQLIFGESFEEPAQTFAAKNLPSYDGEWTVNSGVLHVNPCSGGKCIYEPIMIKNGSVEIEFKFDRIGNANDVMNILMRVNNPRVGADRFTGYEIGLSADGKRVEWGAHRNNWRPITEQSNLNFSPTAWNKLRTEINKNQIKVYLNNKIILSHEDNNFVAINQAGNVGLRTWNAGISFRNLVVTGFGVVKKKVKFTNITDSCQISNMWEPALTGHPLVKYSIIQNDAANSLKSQQIEYLSGKGQAGIVNRGLNKWGIAIKAGHKMVGSIYLKGNYSGAVTLSLQDRNGTVTEATHSIKNITKEWKKYVFELIPRINDNNARLAIYINCPGKINIDQVMICDVDNSFHKLPVRNDIGKAMVKEGLTFLRYGGSMVNAPDYKFKNMIGERSQRKQYKGFWYPYSTNGFGIEEFLQFCEAAGFVPAFAVNVNETSQDMADMIEYLKGPSTSEWGAKRVADGHVKPYKVNYIEIGNEEVIGTNDSAAYQKYIDNFKRIRKAILSKDSTIKFICSAWWRADAPQNMKLVFKALDGEAAYWDYHPLAENLNAGKTVASDLESMQNYFKEWNPKSTMKCTIFEENGTTHNLQRALAHATLQNAARRAGNFILATCAANALEPYLQNDNGWNQGQVFFTSSQVWGMPPYYAQQMAALYHMPLHIKSTAPLSLDVVAATNNSRSRIVIYAVNTNCSNISSNILFKGVNKMRSAKAITLRGNLTDENTPENPQKIVFKERPINLKNVITYTFTPYSYTILVFDK